MIRLKATYYQDHHLIQVVIPFLVLVLSMVWEVKHVEREEDSQVMDEQASWGRDLELRAVHVVVVMVLEHLRVAKTKSDEAQVMIEAKFVEGAAFVEEATLVEEAEHKSRRMNLEDTIVSYLDEVAENIEAMDTTTAVQ